MQHVSKAVDPKDAQSARAQLEIIEGGVGQATVLLPSEVGVRAKAAGGIGTIDAKGLKKVDGAYVNEAYGESDTNLSVDVKGGVGEITLKVV